MSQATRRWISEEVKSLRDSQILPFHEVLDAGMVSRAPHAEGVSSHERIDAPLVTTCLFLSQVIDPDHSCRAAVARLIVRMAVNGRKPCEPDTSSYRGARQRLPEAVIARLVRETARRTDARALGDWPRKGRSVILVDGTTASMPGSLANQEAYPQSKARGIGLGFPLVRPVAPISLATGVVRDLASGYAGERRRARRRCSGRSGVASIRARSCSGAGFLARSSGSPGSRSGASTDYSGCSNGGSSTPAGAAGSACSPMW